MNNYFYSRSRFRSRIYHCSARNLRRCSWRQLWSHISSRLTICLTTARDRIRRDRTTGLTAAQFHFSARAGSQRPRSSWSEIEFRFGRQLYLRTRAEIRRWSGEKRKSGEGWGGGGECGKRNYMQEGSREEITINCPLPRFCRISGLRGCLRRLWYDTQGTNFDICQSVVMMWLLVSIRRLLLLLLF